METLYQRSKIQEESLHYESLKHSGELPVIGVNTFESPQLETVEPAPDSLIRASAEEKEAQLRHLAAVHARWRDTAPAALGSLSAAAGRGENIFEELMETVKTASLGQISEALFEVGGRYRRSM